MFKHKILLITCILISFQQITNSQNSWFRVNTGITGTISKIHFADGNTGYAATATDILKTTNGGINWSVSGIPGTGYVSEIYFLNAQTGFVITDSIYKTTDGGSSFFASGYGSGDIQFTSSTAGFIIGYTIFKTTNGGDSWFSIPVPQYYSGTYNQSGSFINDNTGVVAYSKIAHPNNYTYISRTTNSGASWTQVHSSTAYTIFEDGDLVNSTVYIAYIGGLFRSADSGLTWQIRNISSYNLNAIDFLTESCGFYCGDENELYKTSNSGVSWQFIVTDTVTTFYDIYFPDLHTGYVCGTNGVIFKTTDAGCPIGITQTGNEIPKEFSLYQNYPNPFNPVTMIHFDIPASKGSGEIAAMLTIYDALGREISTLINEKLSPGTYETEWDASYYPSGVYFYKLTAGDYTKTKKMILIK